MENKRKDPHLILNVKKKLIKKLNIWNSDLDPCLPVMNPVFRPLRVTHSPGNHTQTHEHGAKILFYQYIFEKSATKLLETWKKSGLKYFISPSTE